MIGIYKIQNLIDGKVYIGQSVHIQARFNQHKNEAKMKIQDHYIMPLENMELKIFHLKL